MANLAMQNNIYNIDNTQHKQLGTSMTYDAMKMRASRMKKAKEMANTTEFDTLGGDETLKYIKTELDTDRKAIKSSKKIQMDTGRENAFLSTHEKDKDNANPTAVGGLPQMNKGSMNRKIMNNQEIYNESFYERHFDKDFYPFRKQLLQFIDEDCFTIENHPDAGIQIFNRLSPSKEVRITGEDGLVWVYLFQEPYIDVEYKQSFIFDDKMNIINKAVNLVTRFLKPCKTKKLNETLKKELNSIRYLMEYMNNNK